MNFLEKKFEKNYFGSFIGLGAFAKSA